MKPRVTAAEVSADPGWAQALYLQGLSAPAETDRGRRHLTGAGLRSTAAADRTTVQKGNTTMPAKTQTRCVCAAALERARTQYGHLDGRLVWVTRTTEPSSRYRGVLHVLADRPGYLHIDRSPGMSRTWHIDDIAHVITDEEHEANRRRQ